MREILSIHVGQCGNQIADRYWRLVLREHGLTEAGTPKDGNTSAATNANLEVFFHKVRDGTVSNPISRPPKPPDHS